jgi:hypothetical protein
MEVMSPLAAGNEDNSISHSVPTGQDGSQEIFQKPCKLKLNHTFGTALPIK